MDNPVCMIPIVSSLPADSVLFDRELRPNGRTLVFCETADGRSSLYIKSEFNELLTRVDEGR